MFIIKLTPTYRLRIDNYNVSLMKKRTKRPVDEFIADDAGEDNFGVLGYYSIKNLNSLLDTLVRDRIVTKSSKKLVSLTEFDKLVKDTTKELLKQMKPIILADASLAIIEQKNKDIADLKNQIKCLKRKNTLHEKRNNGNQRKIG